MNKKIVEDELGYVIFSEIYNKFTVPKSRRKAHGIIEAAIHCYEKHGFNNTTLKMIARNAGTTVSTLRHYFKSVDEIQDYTVKYVYCTAQKMVIDSMANATDPVDMLKNYLEGHFNWAKQYTRHLHIWNSYNSYGSKRDPVRELNTSAFLNGTKRIAEILARGRKTGQFIHKNDSDAARIIQTILIGWLTILATENIDDVQHYTKHVFNLSINSVTKNFLET